MSQQSVTPKIAVIGEAMLELSHLSTDDAIGLTGSEVRMAYGGDTANTAVYMARLGLHPSYITALGQDPYSLGLISELKREGVLTDQVLQHPSRLPGLYAIQTDAVGERRFYYWREQSAVRDFFSLPGADLALEAVRASAFVYLSGISLSVFSSSDQARLISSVKAVSDAGGTVVFDPNYRAQGWTSPQVARDVMQSIAPHTSIVLPTRSDEDELYGVASAASHAARWLQHGVDTVVVKDGAQGAFIADGNQTYNVPTQALVATDTTGAGDSFNAAFLSAFIGGTKLEQAVIAGHALAAQVVQHRGAIIPRDCMPE